MPRSESIESAEQEIVRAKSELVRMTRERNLALRAGRQEEGQQRHLDVLEAEIKQLDALARYVRTVSPGAARELAARRASVVGDFQRLRAAGNLRELSQWVTQELAPLLNKSEQAAHLVATSMRATPRTPVSPFVWPVGVDRSMKEAKARAARSRVGSP